MGNFAREIFFLTIGLTSINIKINFMTFQDVTHGVSTPREIMKIGPQAKVIMVSAVEQKYIVHDAMKLGSRDFVVKPFDRSNVGLVFGKIMRLRH